MTFGEEVKVKRIEKGLTQAFVGRLVGLSQPYIAQIESGTHDVTLTYAARLAFLLDIDLNEYVRSPYRKKVQSHG